MKFLFASDSFKGSLSSAQTAELLDRAAHEVFGPEGCETDRVPMADGGEGTVDAVLSAVPENSARIAVDVRGPLPCSAVHAFYGKTGSAKAVIEMAAASGLPLVPEQLRNPLLTTTFGTGELIRDAMERGLSDIYIAIGGSATNDGGTGAMRALGIRFLDAEGKELTGTGADLEKIAHIDMDGMDRRIAGGKYRFTVMSDVTNPLCGRNGATRTFGPQKGATPEMLDRLEEGMCHYREVIRQECGTDPGEIPGSGAAGGLGAALQVFLHAEMRSGIETVLDLVGFDDRLDGTDLVITGEGRTDSQSCCGKVMQGVGEHAAAKGVPAIGLCGSLGEGSEKILQHGICALLTTVNAPMTLDEALSRAGELYYNAALQFFRILKTANRL